MTPLLDGRMGHAESVSDVLAAYGFAPHLTIVPCRPRVDKCRPRDYTRAMTKRGVAAPTTIGPFEVLETEAFTECECFIQPCRHAPDYMRPYYPWIVWDAEANEHAYISRKDFTFQPEYERKRDAVADVRRYLERV